MDLPHTGRERPAGTKYTIRGWTMATSFGALCSDFYVNHAVNLKMDLPGERETILHLFDQVRKRVPSMDRFRRYEDELALESTRREAEYRWLVLRHNSIRTGHVNPQSMQDAYNFHRMILQIAPYHLSLSALDIDFLDLMFGFDLECMENHDQVVYDALLAESPTHELLSPDDSRAGEGGKILDVQPGLGMTLNSRGDLQAYFEVKTRTRGRRGQTRQSRQEPISVMLSIRQYGPVDAINNLHKVFDEMKDHAERLAAERLVPHLLTPIARQITSSSA